MLTDTIKAALWEELRFAKRQQWAVTAAVLGLMAGAYTTVQPLGLWEKRVAVSFICIVAVGAAGCSTTFNAISVIHDWPLIGGILTRCGVVRRSSLECGSL